MEEQKQKEQEKQKKYEVYLEERKSLIEAERIGYQQFDKAILTLAAGALVLSITFIRYIAPTPVPNKPFLIIFSWGFLLASILSTLISFVTSQRGCRKQRKILEEYFFSEAKPEASKNPFYTATAVFNIASLFCFTIGVVFLAIFASVNLPR